MAKYFILIGMQRFSSQFRSRGPNRRFAKSQRCHLGEDFEKQVAARMTKGDVGTMGSKTPNSAKEMKKKPKNLYKIIKETHRLYCS